MNNQMPSMPNNFSGFVPPNGQNMGGNFNQSGAERGAEKLQQNVRQAKHIRSTLGHVVHSRAGLVTTLKQWNIDLVTSAKELDETGDFVTSSYVIYKNHNDFKETLFSFLQRYPDFAAQIKEIEDHAQNVKGKIGLNDVKVTPQMPTTVIGNMNGGVYPANSNYANNYNPNFYSQNYPQNPYGQNNMQNLPQNYPNQNGYNSVPAYYNANQPGNYPTYHNPPKQNFNQYSQQNLNNSYPNGGTPQQANNFSSPPQNNQGYPVDSQNLSNSVENYQIYGGGQNYGDYQAYVPTNQSQNQNLNQGQNINTLASF